MVRDNGANECRECSGETWSRRHYRKIAQVTDNEGLDNACGWSGMSLLEKVLV